MNSGKKEFHLEKLRFKKSCNLDLKSFYGKLEQRINTKKAKFVTDLGTPFHIFIDLR